MSEAMELYQQSTTPIGETQLGVLSQLCQEMLDLENASEKLAADLADVNKRLQEYRIGRIPGLMNELNLSELKLASGAKIAVSQVINCRFKIETKQDALQWLDDNNFGSMVKHEVSVDFGKGEDLKAKQAVAALTDMGLQPSDTKDVHFQTLSAWARRQVAENATLPSNLFDLSILNIAKVKS